MTAAPHRIGFIGAGKVATVLATALVAKRYAVGAVYSRTGASATRLAAALPSTRVCSTIQEVAELCDLVFVATPDDAISGVAGGVRWMPGQSAVHCSGALSLDVLAPVAQAGGHVGGFHPLQSFAATGINELTGVTVALEAEPPLLGMLRTIARDLGAHSVVVPSEGKAAYHISGVLVSNYVVTLVKTATDLLKGLGISEIEAREALLTLLQGTVNNMYTLGVPGALTGPIARGDVGTVEHHLAALVDKPEARALYVTLAEQTIPIGEAKGTLSPDAARRIRVLVATVPNKKAPTLEEVESVR